MQPIAVFETLPPELSWKEKVAYLGVQFGNVEATPCPVEHLFGHGLYVRSITIPAGTVFLGREHLQGHEVTLLEGSVILITPEGRRQVDAVTTLHSQPGFLMVVAALTDVKAQTVHPNADHCTDIEELESRIFGSVEELRELGLTVERRLLT